MSLPLSNVIILHKFLLSAFEFYLTGFLLLLFYLGQGLFCLCVQHVNAMPAEAKIGHWIPWN